MKVLLKKDKPEYWTSGYIAQAGPWIPVLPDGESVHTLTHEELSDLLQKAYTDGYNSARARYELPITSSATSI